ncbi:MAG: DUF928 domain-containing protein, partial [Kovacikia sp.]
MSQCKKSSQRLSLIGTIVLTFSLVMHPSSAQAGWFDWLLGSSPVTGTPSGRRTGGGDRSGSCPKSASSLTALAPLYKGEDGEHFILGSTVSAYPTLWFYLPYSVTETRPAELRIEEHQGQYIFDRTIATITQASVGVIGISLPPGKIAPLEVGEPRYFKFVIRCDPQDSSANKFVS